MSCLCVTRDRFDHLRRAVQCYADQTWPRRELVIVTEGSPAYRDEIRSMIAAHGRSDIRLVALEGDDWNLGKVRNASLDAARGDVVCQWDDDDLYHPDRLRVQVQHLVDTGADACLLSDQLQYFWDDGELYWLDWSEWRGSVTPTAARPSGIAAVAPGSLMMWRDPDVRYPTAGPFARAGEDWILLRRLARDRRIAALAHVGHLYVYTFHGANTYGRLHHLRLAAMRAAAPERFGVPDQALAEALAYFALPGAPPVGDPDAAEARYLHALQADATSAAGLFHRGWLARQQGDVGAACRLLAEAARLRPDDPEIWLERARASSAARDRDAAFDCYQRVVDLHPGHQEALTAQAMLRLEQGRPVEALPLFEAAAAAEAETDDHHNAYGIALHAAGRVDEAITAFTLAVRRDPEDQQALANLRNAVRADLALAVKVFAELAERCPPNAAVQVFLGQFLAANRRFGEAEHAIGRALASTVPTVRAQAHLLRARIHRQRQSHATSIPAYEASLGEDHALDVAVELADYLLTLGRPEDAIHTLDALTALQVGDARVAAARERANTRSRGSGSWTPRPAATRDAWSGVAPTLPEPGPAPVFLLAAGWRTGSTLVQRLLMSSGDLWMWGEPHGAANLIQSLTDSTWAAIVDPHSPYLHPNGLDGRQLAGRWIANLSPDPARLGAAARALIDTWLASPEPGTPRFGLKEVRLGARHARFLRWLYPGCRFVFLVRNPWDAWASYGAARFYARWPDRPVATAEQFAAHWSELAGGFVRWPFDDALLVRYEDLRDPRTLEALAAHAGTRPLDASVLDHVLRGRRAPPEAPTPDDDAVLAARCAPVAGYLGYDGFRTTRPRP